MRDCRVEEEGVEVGEYCQLGEHDQSQHTLRNRQRRSQLSQSEASTQSQALLSENTGESNPSLLWESNPCGNRSEANALKRSANLPPVPALISSYYRLLRSEVLLS